MLRLEGLLSPFFEEIADFFLARAFFTEDGRTSPSLACWREVAAVAPYLALCKHLNQNWLIKFGRFIRSLENDCRTVGQ